MSPFDAVELPCAASLTSEQLHRKLSELVGGDATPGWILIRATDVDAPSDAIAMLASATAEPLVASCSPVPVPEAGRRLVAVGSHAAAPPPAPVPLPCLDVCLVSKQALLSDPGEPGARDGTWREALAATMQRLTNAGWRHVVSPGVAFDWTGVTVPTRVIAGWSADTVRSVVEAQPALEAHRLWASTRLRPPRVVIDGACVSDDVHNGTQVVVLHLVQALAATRPSAEVALAVRPVYLAVASELLRGSGVRVIERRGGQALPFDIAYRPYQSIDPTELGWLVGAGRRIMVGQLDMIGFSNPSYHPSRDLFHTVRNLQRHMLRIADGVTFISVFGRTTTQAECPEIPEHRLHVVGCGVDVDPEPAAACDADPPVATPFVLCLSATFHHKNRAHAIRTFAHMCERHGYPGSLVIAGPEPYYGRSADASMIRALAPEVGARVTPIGNVDQTTKWWLLTHADLVLYPSVVEGFGLVPFEAAAVGTPSLSYDGSGLQEVLSVADALVPTWDPLVWAARAAELVSDPSRRAALVGSVRAAGDRHRWADVAGRTWDAIDTTIALPSVSAVDEGSRWAHVSRSSRAVLVTTPARHLSARVSAALKRRVPALGDRLRRIR